MIFVYLLGAVGIFQNCLGCVSHVHSYIECRRVGLSAASGVPVPESTLDKHLNISKTSMYQETVSLRDAPIYLHWKLNVKSSRETS